VRIIAVTAGKGGVGKTTLTANLGVALCQLGFRVCVIDANFTAPDLAIHFGFSPETTIWEVLKGKEGLDNALYEHACGVHIIPGSQDMEVATNRETYKRLKRKMRKLKYDFVILDTPPGLGEDARAALIPAKEVLVVATPEWTSLANAYRAMLFAQQMNKQVLGMVLNRASAHELEPNPMMVEHVIGTQVLATIPEDIHVRKSVSLQNPVCLAYPNSESARQFRKVAHYLGGLPWHEKLPWWQRLFTFVGKV